MKPTHSPIPLLTSFLALGIPALAVPCGGDNTNPGHGTCTSTSARENSWTLHNLEYHASYTFSTPSHQIPSGHVNFTLTNPALDYAAHCEAYSSRLTDFFYGELTYDCAIPADAKDRGDMASFTYSEPQGRVTLNQTWVCPEGGNGNGKRWHATGNVTVDLDCETTRWKNPDWQIGEIYSTRTVSCVPVTVEARMEEKGHGGGH